MQIKTDSAAYVENPKSIQLPAAGGKYIDDLAGAEVMRFTDAHDGNGGSFTNTYSVWPTANSDNTKLWMFEQSGPYYVGALDPVSFTRIGSLQEVTPAPAKIYADNETAFWSFSDPDKIFILIDAKIYFYRPSTRAYTLIKDLTSLFPAATFFKQLYVSKDDNRFAALALNNTLGDQGFLVYDLATDTVKLNVKVDNINGITMDKSGKYVFLVRYVDDPAKQYVYNVDTGAIETLISDRATGLPDFTIGHNDAGTDFIVGGDQWHGAVTARAMSTPHDLTVAWQYTKVTGWISWHVSLRADNEAWALVSTFGPITVPPSDQIRAFEREIFQVGVKAPYIGQVRRLVHDRSAWVAPNYWDSARANISRDGRLLFYTSNNNGVSGVDRTDLFVAKIDSAQNSTTPVPSPTPSTPQSSPDGTKATSITDSSGNVWTLGPKGETLKNGVSIGGGLGTTYKWWNSSVYVLGLDSNWWQWTGTKWLKQNAQEPGVTIPVPAPTPVPSPTPQPTPVPVPARTAYEYTKASFTTETQFEAAIQNAVGQGYGSFITGPSGKTLYGFRVKQ